MSYHDIMTWANANVRSSAHMFPSRWIVLQPYSNNIHFTSGYDTTDFSREVIITDLLADEMPSSQRSRGVVGIVPAPIGAHVGEPPVFRRRLHLDLSVSVSLMLKSEDVFGSRGESDHRREVTHASTLEDLERTRRRVAGILRVKFNRVIHPSSPSPLFGLLMRDAVEVSAELRVFGDDVFVADVDENMESERLEIGSVLAPSRVVELEAIPASLFLVRDVEDLDAILLGEDAAFVFAVVIAVVIVGVFAENVTTRC